MQTEGVREQLSSPKQLFLWEGSHRPSFAAHAAAGHCLACRLGRCYLSATGRPHLFSWNEKRKQKNHMGRHLDTPSEIILQARLRMHFEGGQGRCIFLADSVAELSA